MLNNVKSNFPSMKWIKKTYLRCIPLYFYQKIQGNDEQLPKQWLPVILHLGVQLTGHASAVACKLPYTLSRIMWVWAACGDTPKRRKIWRYTFFKTFISFIFEIDKLCINIYRLYFNRKRSNSTSSKQTRRKAKHNKAHKFHCLTRHVLYLSRHARLDLYPDWKTCVSTSRWGRGKGRGSTRQQWNLDVTRGQGTGKICCYNEVSLYRGSFSFILLLLRQRKSFVIPRTSLNATLFPWGTRRSFLRSRCRFVF